MALPIQSAFSDRFGSPNDRSIARNPAPGSAPLLSVNALTAGFSIGGRFLPAVQDVTFELSAGETLCLVGESGCGKTVTALAIVGLLQPPGRVTSGDIWFHGRNLLALSEPEMREVRGAGIGFVFQEPITALNPVLTIGDQIAEVLVAHARAPWRTARDQAVALLETVRIADPARRARDYPHQLSGGMLQRVMIAAALACDPPLLVADEPTTALDVTIQAEILDLLRELRERLRLALLLVTHDLGVVAQTADRVAVMYASRIVEEAPVGAIFHDPKHPYTRGLLASIPGRSVTGRLYAIEGVVPPLGSLPPGCAFEPRCAERLAACRDEPPYAATFALNHRAHCHLYGPGRS
jgi:peptide/nickel transport system ATP-binding protein